MHLVYVATQAKAFGVHINISATIEFNSSAVFIENVLKIGPV